MSAKARKKTYYKVVTEDLKSAIALMKIHHSDKELILQYQLHCWRGVKIPYTKLMVFDNLDAAKQFQIINQQKRTQSLVVYECEVIKPTKTGIFTGRVFWFGGGGGLQHIKKLAELRKNKKAYLGYCDNSGYGRGFFVDAVKLTKRIEC